MSPDAQDEPAQNAARLDAIRELGRSTRKPVPRGMWIAAALVAVICATGLAVVLLGDPAPRGEHPVPPAAVASPGRFGTGLGIGAAVGLAIGFALGRQRRDHSSRRRP